MSQLTKLIGKTIKHYMVCGNHIDLTFTDNTKVYDITGNPRWVKFDEKGYPIREEKITIGIIYCRKCNRAFGVYEHEAYLLNYPYYCFRCKLIERLKQRISKKKDDG